LFLTSRSDEQDITEALNAGADDYCTKPVRPGEFAARVKALLRRVYPTTGQDESIRTLLDYTFNKSNNQVTYQGQANALSDKEFKLALFLFDNAERAVSRERIIQEIWGHQGDDISRSLDVHISWLRKKLNLAATSQHLRLKPIYGFGYRLMAVQGAEDAYVTLVVVSHSAAMLSATNRLVVLDKGRVLADGATDKLLKN
jgi:two-component system, OmpR family, response regulator RegX3